MLFRTNIGSPDPSNSLNFPDHGDYGDPAPTVFPISVISVHQR
jgi:hypothetical protein